MSRHLRLAATCPRCDSPPLDWIPRGERARYAGDAPELVLRQVVCHRPGCGQRYPITARAYQDAA